MHHSALSSRVGFTITELLVAATIALAVMGAVATLFSTFGSAASQSQAIIDLGNRMRAVSTRLRRDLQGATASLQPPASPEASTGYFELIEGPQVDLLAQSGTLAADWDDILLFTTRSSAAPFVGRYTTTSGSQSQIESKAAEVAWFCRPSPTTPVPGLTLYTLYRRQLLVVGYVGIGPFHVPGSVATNRITAAIPAVFNSYDISLRPEGSAVVPNTLADLTQRENRFLHGSWNAAFSPVAPGAVFDAASGREGEDVVLTNVLSFDVRVFDPDVLARTNAGTVLYPGDPDFLVATGTTTTTGAFVDLGRAQVGTVLSGSASPKAGGLLATYDTWSTAYEFDGIDNSVPASLIDEGTNGEDNGGSVVGGPDDPGESETSPPYPVRLRAIDVRIRCYEPVSQQVRQVTIRHAFEAK